MTTIQKHGIQDLVLGSTAGEATSNEIRDAAINASAAGANILTLAGHIAAYICGWCSAKAASSVPGARPLVESGGGSEYKPPTPPIVPKPSQKHVATMRRAAGSL